LRLSFNESGAGYLFFFTTTSKSRQNPVSSKSEKVDSSPDAGLTWASLSSEAREGLSGKLAGLWNWPTDQAAFESLSVDKQQALLLLMQRLNAQDLWHFVRKVQNVYGEGGVGIDFTAWPGIKATLNRRKDFTRLFAKRKTVSGGFYERGRPRAVFHFLYTEGSPALWHVHFDLYSPLYSVNSAVKHWRHEYFSSKKPDWRIIETELKD
jgi:hypothetical protein